MMKGLTIMTVKIVTSESVNKMDMRSQRASYQMRRMIQSSKNDSLNDIHLKMDIQLRMTLGHNNIDGEDIVIVNKMAKVFRQGKVIDLKQGQEVEPNYC